MPWHFNRPSSLHFGGAWECLVQSAKRVLKAVVGKQCVNDEMLLTFMAEVESLMNGRPLTHVSTDYRDEESLTPNHFLLGRANPNFLPDVVNDKDLCNGKRWKHARVMTQHFWKPWLWKYLQYRSNLWDHFHAVKRSLPNVVGANSPRWDENRNRGELDGLGKNTIVTNYYCISIVKHYLTFHPLQAL